MAKSSRSKRIILPGGCYCSQPSVHPNNWNTKQASCKDPWYIQYRFYDPSVMENGKPSSKQKIIKGMNDFATLADRQLATETLLQHEMKLLTGDGYNIITGQFMFVEQKTEFELSPSTPVIEAYWHAWRNMPETPTKKGIKWVIQAVAKAADQLHMTSTPVSNVTRRHFKALLAQCEKNAKKWSNHSFNHYRAYLMMLYNELIELEAVEFNYLKAIAKKTETKKIKAVLDLEQRKEIDGHLLQAFPKFRSFIHLFFHSGARKTEILQLKPGNVDLKKQVYRCIVRKRKTYEEVVRTIKDVALPYWKEFLTGCRPDQFLFGPRFEPAEKAMGIGMPSRYWKEYVKDEKKKGGLGIKIDFYSLKHLNTSEVVSAVSKSLDEARSAAAELNAHTTTAMVVNIYDVQNKNRNHELLKPVNNSFAG